MISRVTARWGWRWSVGALVLAAAVALAACRRRADALHDVRFRTEREGVVMLNLHRADGTLVRRLIAARRVAAGEHQIAWDGRAEDGALAAPGEYSWRGFSHEGIGLELRSWEANSIAMPDGKGDWGGEAGVPSAVAADAEKVYLGWSLAGEGKSVLACDLEGRAQWGHRRAEGASGCKALAVDDGVVYVLGGLAGVAAEGGAIYKLSAKDGQPVPWPDGALDLKIASFWPADATTKPDKADSMAVRHGHIYLAFTSSEFMTVLDAKTGAYLQTVVGAPPGLIDVVATQTDLPDAPGKLVDADFAVISLGGGVLGKVLFAHDPLWVVTSELTPLEREERITALTVIGDGAKHHRHTAFVGLGAPFHQVQARPLLNTESFTWVAGQAGGRPPLGPWQAAALRDIRGVALAADGRLWIAEGDAWPRRFSVWETSGTQGKLVREFFATPGPVRAVHPLDPQVTFADGCEWRSGERLACLGVIARERAVFAAYAVAEDGRVYLLTSPREDGGDVRIFERLGEGDCRLREELMRVENARFLSGGKITGPAAR